MVGTLDESVVKAIQGYLAALEVAGIHPAIGVVFGSFARGNSHEWSDIDLIVVAPEFDGTRTWDQIEDLWRITAQTDCRIEPIACGLREWQEGSGRPIVETARAEGIEVPYRGASAPAKEE